GAADPGTPARRTRGPRRHPGAHAGQGPPRTVRLPRRRCYGLATLCGRCRVGGPGGGFPPRRARGLHKGAGTSTPREVSESAPACFFSVVLRVTLPVGYRKETSDEPGKASPTGGFGPRSVPACLCLLPPQRGGVPGASPLHQGGVRARRPGLPHG